MNKQLLVLYTGGTIGMVHSDMGVMEPISLEELLKYLPEVEQIPVEVEFAEHSSIKDSSNHTVEDWNSIARHIENVYDRFDGFIVVHGTDTLCYSAAALDKIIQQNSKPIIFTGAQKPFGAYLSDAKENLLGSINAAYSCIENGKALVGVFFHGKLFPSSTSFKKHRTQFEAFDTTDGQLLGQTYDTFELNVSVINDAPEEQASFTYLKNKNIVWLSHQISSDIDYLISSILNMKPDALVLEGFGTGNFPISEKVIAKLKSYILAGNTLVITSESPYGSTKIGQYSNGKKLLEIGAQESGLLSKAALYVSLM